MTRIDFKTKNLYGMIGMGDAIVYCFIGTFLLFFLTTVAHIPPAIAGTIAAIGSVWDVVSSSLVGYLSDNCRSRFGRRKPFVMAGAFPLGVATALLFTTVHLPQPARIAYYMIVLLIVWGAFCVFYVPYLAWGAELTQDYDERTSLRGYVYVYNTLGGAIGTILPTVIVDALMQVGRSQEGSWQAVGIFCGIVTALVIFIGGWGIRQEPAGEEEEKVKKPAGRTGLGVLADIIRNYWEILHLRSARCIIQASIFYLLANTMISSDRMYFYTYNLQLPAWTISAVMAFQTFISVIFVPVLVRLTKRFDKRTMFLAGMGISTAVSVFFGLAGIPNAGQMIVYSFFISIGSICYWQLIAAMVYDVCEDDQLTNSKERSGMVISMQSISESFAEAVGLQILGIILGAAGFDGAAASQTGTALLWTHLSLTILPAGFMILTLICIWRYPITKQVYYRILQALEERRQAEEEGEKV
ncbi:MAG: MFS transporter [Firmicutes bacterium]|nr:MFS transporter [Bacillota bacterium]